MPKGAGAWRKPSAVSKFRTYCIARSMGVPDGEAVGDLPRKAAEMVAHALIAMTITGYTI